MSLVRVALALIASAIEAAPCSPIRLPSMKVVEQDINVVILRILRKVRVALILSASPTDTPPLSPISLTPTTTVIQCVCYLD